VSYLQIVEKAVTDDIASGHHDRGIRIARRALEVDPTVESLERSLLRLYRSIGAHAAAAEQYAHYAGMVREELGIDPPPLASL
jgi:DNA-binding SARP family transcriptional activator